MTAGLNLSESACLLATPSTFLVVFVIGLITHLLRSRFKPVLRNIPGPTLAAYTNLWRLNDVRKGQAHWTAIKLHRRYGPLVRIGPNHVSVSDPREINNIYGLKNGFTKTAFYPIQSISWQKKPQMNLFSTRDEASHRDQKRPIASAFSMTSLLTKEDAVDSCGNLFIENLARFADQKTPVDMGLWLQYYAFDIIGELSFAKKFGFLDLGKDVDSMIETIESMLVYASHCGQVPMMHRFLLGNPLFPILIPSLDTWNKVLQFTLQAVNSVIGEQGALKRDGELEAIALDRKGDMLSRWSAINLTNPEKISTKDIVVHLTGNVFAGSDTTAIALRSTLYYLTKELEKMRKLVEEIDNMTAANKLSDPVSYKEASTHLPYLNAVIKEAIRIHPSVGLLLERHVPPGGAFICGKHIPEGTIVGINAWVTQHDPEVFPNPEKFEPERWLDSSEEQLRQMEQSFFAFGAGTRTCIGKNISIIEMVKIIPQLLRKFEITLKYPDMEWKTKNIWFVQQEGLICNLKIRK